MTGRILHRAAILAFCFVFSCCSLLSSSRTVHYLMYPVQRGDSLYQISQRFGVSVDELREINKIKDPRALVVGHVLKVPYRPDHVRSSQRSRTKAKGFQRGDAEADAASVSTVSLTSAKRYVDKLVWPIESGQLSSLFGWRWLSFHEGIDIAAPEGTPVRAAHDGRVVYRNNGIRGYGKLVIVQSPGLLTVYGHNSAYAVQLGDQVRAGDVIAYVGATGESRGTHLHFETRIKDREGRNSAVDPLVFYPLRK